MTSTFYETVNCLLGMQWNFIPVNLSMTSKNLPCEEAVFLFDLNKLSYVCFLEKVDDEFGEIKINQGLSERRDIVMLEAKESASQILGTNDFEFLTLYIVKDNGKPWLKLLPKPRTELISTFFHIDELKYIANYEESDPLMLWKFSKAYTELINECKVKSKGGNLSIFAAYRQNENCIWPRGEERPDLIIFRSSLSVKYKKSSDKKRNEHLAAFHVDGNITNVRVYNYCDYAPFYREVGDVNNETILLEDFPRSIWFVNHQCETHHPQFISSQLEMLAFWLLVIGPEIECDFDFVLGNNPLIVNIILDSKYKVEMRPGDVPFETPLNSINIPVIITASNINITIPVELANWYSKSDNRGERHVIFHFLKAIIKSKEGDTSEKIKLLIDKFIPVGVAKMATILANANNIILETRHLPAYRKIQQYDLSEIRINLTRFYGIKIDKSHFTSKNDKKKICTEVAKVLHDHLIAKLKEFDSMMLLPFLLNCHEACVQKKAIQQLDLPARTALFGANSTFILNEFSKEQDRIKTALSLRCLIELIVAYNMIEGKKETNFDDIDKLTALMNEMIAWANLSDGIHLGLYDPSMQILPCGRIDVDYDSINSKMLSFGFAKIEIELDQYDSGYDELFNAPDAKSFNPDYKEIEEIDNAFHQELGITFFRLHDFLIDLVNFTRSNDTSTVSIDEEVLFKKLKETKFKWKDSEIRLALNALTLIQGWEIDKPPYGYRNKDTRPWHYNRALSFLRRPIAKLTIKERTYYLWSYRHLFAAFENTCTLLMNGILWYPGNGPINQVVKKYANKKGDYFRANVHSWLKEDPDFKVLEEEVHIKPGALLDAEIDLGDIDIFMINHKQKIIYSIECKNTSESKSVHDFKTDLDQYLKPTGKRYIEKHQKRDMWLKKNINQLSVYVETPEIYDIISIVVTAFEIPLSFTHESALPIISFPRLKMEGITILKNLKSAY